MGIEYQIKIIREKRQPECDDDERQVLVGADQIDDVVAEGHTSVLAAFVLAHLEPEQRRAVMERLFGAAGADFTLARTHIGACDFSVEGKYSYAARAGDARLKTFTIAPDTEGFDPARWPGVRDARYDLLPMIQEALAIKRAQPDSTLRIIASAWTAPPWIWPST